jgi:transcriptional regulator with XRE-family HTH domain
MDSRKKPTSKVPKEIARQRRADLYEAVNRSELSLQETVKRMRQISRLTQPDFAAHRGVSAKVIKEIERGIGNPTVNTLNRIGQFFGLEVAFVRSDRLRPQAALAVSDSISTAVAPAAIDQVEQLMQDLEDIKQRIKKMEPR